MFRDNSVASLSVQGRELAAGSPSVFCRDFAANSVVYAFTNGRCADLGLEGDQVLDNSTCIHGGRLRGGCDGKDRRNRSVALPVDATGWRWAMMSHRPEIAGTGEFALYHQFAVGCDGKMSRYPWARFGMIVLASSVRGHGETIAVPHRVSRGHNQFFLAWDFV